MLRTTSIHAKVRSLLRPPIVFQMFISDRQMCSGPYTAKEQYHQRIAYGRLASFAYSRSFHFVQRQRLLVKAHGDALFCVLR